MKDWDIKTRVLLLALLPSIIISSLLGCYFTLIRFRDLSVQLRREGTALVHGLDTASKSALFKHNITNLQALVDNTLQLSNVEAVTFYDEAGKILAFQGPEALKSDLTEQQRDAKKFPSMIDIGEYYIFTQPILLANRDVHTGSKSQTFSNQNDIASNKKLGWVAIYYSPAKMRLEEYAAIITSSLMLLVGLIISMVLAWRIGRDITGPLITITNVVNRLKRGDLNARVPIKSGGQLGILAEGVNEMAAALKSSQEELQHNIEQATKDLTESLETVEIQNIELNIARKDALEASRVKSEFIANISHEIRTPMNSIIGFTNLLLETELNAHQCDYLITIKKSAGNLLDIINDILDFSKIEAGKLRLHYIPMDIRECVDDVLELLAQNAHAKYLELACIIEQDVPLRLIGDPLRLKQIMINLVGNAIKFTERGSVEVTVSLDNEISNNYQLRIGVSDTGLGLSVDDQKQLFRAFSQADTTARRKYGGTGLGLVISKKLINQMGGAIGVHSEPGHGSTFWFTFLSEKSKVMSNETIEYKRLANMPVLLFEPYQTAQSAMILLLESWQMSVITCDRLNNILNYSVETNDDNEIIIIGYNQLTDELINTVRQLKQQTQSRVVVMINTVEQDALTTLRNVGADLVLSKPINRKKLYHELCKLLVNKPVSQAPSNINLNLAKPFQFVTHASKTPIRVLAVDDNPANLKLLTVLLEKFGVSVSKANSGERALALAAQQGFDLILMDIQMPNLDGIEVTNRIRKPHHLNRTTPIIAISAHVIGYEKETLLAAGINDYLTKPINTEQLYQLLNKWTSMNIEEDSMYFSHSDVIFMSENLKVLDHELGLKLAGGKADLAQELLEMLIEKLPLDREEISKIYKIKDQEKLLEVVHKLHGATCYCGVPRLKHAASTLETAIKSHDDEHMEELLDILLREIDAVLIAQTSSNNEVK
jgi:two-component system sensor histidine kinase BarA